MVEVYGPPAGVVGVSVAWVVQFVALKAGNVADAAPEPPSVTVATNSKFPAALDLKNTTVPFRNAPVGPLASATDTVGAVLSTRTLVVVALVNVLPDLSVVITRRS